MRSCSARVKNVQAGQGGQIGGKGLPFGNNAAGLAPAAFDELASSVVFGKMVSSSLITGVFKSVSDISEG